MKLPPRIPFYPKALSDLGLTPRAIEIIKRAWPKVADLEEVTDAVLQNHGLTPAQARRLRAAMDLVIIYRHRGWVDENIYRGPVLDDPAGLVDWIRCTIGWPDRELFMTVNLDARYHVLGTNLVALGDVTSVHISPRMVFHEAARAMAASLILVHNHPSGNPTPSDNDILLTHRMARVGSMLGIPVLDHLVLGKGYQACSMLKMGILPRDPESLPNHDHS